MNTLETTPSASPSDSRRSIIRAATHFFSGTMLSRVSGLARDLSMAYAFGTQSAIAALLVAFRFAHLLRRLLGEGAMQTALIPHFEGLRKENSRQAGQFFCDLTATLTHSLLLFILLIMSVLGAGLYWEVFDTGNAEIAWLTFLMMPSLLFICLFGINASLMQCEKIFFLSSAAPIAFNLFWIAGIAFSYFFPIQEAVSLLSLFIVIACFAQWAVTVPRVSLILQSFGTSSLWKGKLYSSEVLQLGKPLFLGILGIGAAQINNALDAIFARWSDPEGPAILWYAIRLQQLPLALFGIAIANAVMPPLARARKNQDYETFRRFLKFAISRTLVLMLPITVAIFVFGEFGIRLIYGHGEFNNLSVIKTTHALWGYSSGLIPMALVLVVAPAFYACADYRTPALASISAMLLNIALNTFFVMNLEWGATSIAIATSISSWFNLFWLGISLFQQQNHPSTP